MPISDQQLHQATHHISQLCKFRTDSFGSDKLSNSDKKHLEDFLFSTLHAMKNNPVITINPFQKSMKAFRQYLGQNQILFPKGITITLYRNGTTYSNSDLIYDFKSVRNKAMRKAKEVAEEVVQSIRRSSSSFLNDSSASIDNDNIERTNSPSFASIRRTTSDSELSIKRSSSTAEIQALTYQYDALSIRKSTSDALKTAALVNEAEKSSARPEF